MFRAAWPALLVLPLIAGCPPAARKDPLHQWSDKKPTAGATGQRASTRPAASAPAASQRSGMVSVGAGRDVLQINDEIVTVEDILRPIRAKLEKAAASMSSNDYYAFVIRAVRDQLVADVSQRLVWKEASRSINEEMQKRIDAVVDQLERDRINRDFAGRESRYEEAIVREGRTRLQVREELRRHVVVQQYIRDRLVPQVSVTRRDLLRYYEQHKAEFSRPARVEMFLIDIPLRALLKSSELSDDAKIAAARKAARERLEEARGKLLAGEPFDKIAREYSRGLHAESGGRWGFISEPLERYWAEPSRRVLQLGAGEVSEVRETADCVYLVKAGQVEKGETTSFAAAQPKIVERVRSERLARLEGGYLQSLLDRSSIGRMEPFVQAIIARAPECKRISPAESRR